MTGKQLGTLEHGYLMALCVLDYYRLQGVGEGLSVGQFSAVMGLDWNECEELQGHLERKGIETNGDTTEAESAEGSLQWVR